MTEEKKKKWAKAPTHKEGDIESSVVTKKKAPSASGMMSKMYGTKKKEK